MSKKDKSEDVGDNGGKRKWSFLNFYDADSCEDDEDDDKASKSKINTDWSLSKVFSFFQVRKTDSENLSDQLKKLEIELSNCEMEIKAASANVLSTTGDMQAYWMREEEALRRERSLLLTRIIAAEAR